jgi:hypothetical protein
MPLQALHLRGELLPSYGRQLKHGLGFFIRRVIRMGPALLRVAPVFARIQLRGTRHSRFSLVIEQLAGEMLTSTVVRKAWRC